MNVFTSLLRGPGIVPVASLLVILDLLLTEAVPWVGPRIGPGLGPKKLLVGLQLGQAQTHNSPSSAVAAVSLSLPSGSGSRLTLGPEPLCLGSDRKVVIIGSCLVCLTAFGLIIPFSGRNPF